MTSSLLMASAMKQAYFPDHVSRVLLNLPFHNRQKARSLQELAAINKQLTLQRQFFTEADQSVQRLIKERQAILQYIDGSGGG